MTSLFGILFALACSVAGNVGFIYKHRGACAAPAANTAAAAIITRRMKKLLLFFIARQSAG